MKKYIGFTIAALGLVACTSVPPPPAPVGAVQQAGVAVSSQAQACLDTGFDIYFATGQTDLNSSAEAVIEQISKAYEPCDVSLLMVEGHADASGDAETNLMISEKRSLSVVAALVKAGISADRVRVVPLGEQEAITEDGLIEPQNRKTTVRIVT
jgi:OOP family OmpA-OmpF porin